MSRTISRSRPLPGASTAADWDGFASRVEANVDRILEQFAEAGVPATFFTLGWIAERHPAMVRRIVAAGTNSPATATTTPGPIAQTRDGFRADVRRTRGLLEDIGGVAVHGYRAATFSIGARNQWAFGVLRGGRLSLQLQHQSDQRTTCTACPTRRARRFVRDGGRFGRFPMTTVRAFGRNWPCSGGGYFRLLPETSLSAWPGAGEPARATARHLLFSSLGNRSRPAARSPAAAGSRGFGTTPICRAWRHGSTGCWATSPGTGWTGCSPICWPGNAGRRDEFRCAQPCCVTPPDPASDLSGASSAAKPIRH